MELAPRVGEGQQHLALVTAEVERVGGAGMSVVGVRELHDSLRHWLSRPASCSAVPGSGMPLRRISEPWIDSSQLSPLAASGRV